MIEVSSGKMTNRYRALSAKPSARLDGVAPQIRIAVVRILDRLRLDNDQFPEWLSEIVDKDPLPTWLVSEGYPAEHPLHLLDISIFEELLTCKKVDPARLADAFKKCIKKNFKVMRCRSPQESERNNQALFTNWGETNGLRKGVEQAFDSMQRTPAGDVTPVSCPGVSRRCSNGRAREWNNSPKSEIGMTILFVAAQPETCVEGASHV